MKKFGACRGVGLCAVLLAAGCTEDPIPSQWAALGVSVDGAEPWPRFLPSVAMDPSSDRPVVSLHERTSEFGSVVRVKAWSGSAWEELGPTPGAGSPQGSSIAVGGDGTVWLACIEEDVDAASRQRFFVARWAGSGWETLGGDLGVTASSDPSIALDRAGSPWLAWSERGASSDVRVQRWDGSAWVTVGADTLDPGLQFEDRSPALTMGASDAPVLVWDSTPSGSTSSAVVVKRWDGAAWTLLGQLDGGAAGHQRAPSAAFAPGGTELFVTYRARGGVDAEGTADHDVHVERWDGAAWSAVGGTFDEGADSNVEATSIVVDVLGRPVVAWAQEGEGSSDVRVARWNGTAWDPLEGALDVASNAFDPSITVDAAGVPLVVWHDNPKGVAHVEARRWTGAM